MNISQTKKRAPIWRVRGKDLNLVDRTLIMAIVNTTPDSFSDGGRFALAHSSGFQVDVDQAVRYAMDQIENGADIIDLGGQSTRPGSQTVSAEEEIQRVLPVLKELVKRTQIPISIDTTSACVAKKCAEAGAAIINDISGGTFEPEIVEIVRQYKLGFCVCHIQGVPATMQNRPEYDDVVTDVFNWLKSRCDFLERSGIERSRICLDPGLGFGKTFEQNIALIQNIELFYDLDCPLLVGHSRKSMFKHFFEQYREFDSREEESLVREILTSHLSCYLAEKGIQILRVHQTAINRAALNFDRLIRQE